MNPKHGRILFSNGVVQGLIQDRRNIHAIFALVAYDFWLRETGAGKGDRLCTNQEMCSIAVERGDGETGRLEGRVMKKINLTPIRRPDWITFDTGRYRSQFTRMTSIGRSDPDMAFFRFAAIRDERQILAVGRENRAFIF